MSLLVSLRSSVLHSWQEIGAEVAMPKGTGVRGGGCQGAREVCCGLLRVLNEEREPSSASCPLRGRAANPSPETSAGCLVTRHCITQLSLKRKHNVISAYVSGGRRGDKSCMQERVGGQWQRKQEGGCYHDSSGACPSATCLPEPMN